MNRDYFAKLGPPNIKIAGLAIWIHGREFPNSEDYWDGNWLNGIIHCGAEGATVRVTGSIIHLSDIARLLSETEKLQKTLTENIEIEIECIEPNLLIKFETEKLGRVKMSVDITPNHLHQKHNFVFEIDQSYLPKLISDCQATLKKYPIIGKP
jgi:hypothetical protein